jgi:hypothetical protein
MITDLIGKAEFQVNRVFCDKNEFGQNSEIHVFERPEHAVFYLSQLEPVTIDEEKGEAMEHRYLVKVVRYKAKKPVAKKVAKKK